MKERAIMHMDGDAFFAAVEIAKNPALKGKPVVVGAERGIASAFSYEAKALGIVRGMPIFQIRKKFPKITILPGDYASYAEYSAKMFDVVGRYTDTLEEYSIDECFADLTGWDKPFKMTYEDILKRIQKEISDELNIDVSLGVAPTKVLAKVASKWNKPRGLTVIEKNKIPDFLKNVPIEKVWGIGPRTSIFLKKKGIGSAHDFYLKDENWVKTLLSKPYLEIWKELHGVTVSQVDPKAKDSYDSIQKTRTFHPATNDKEFLLSQLSKHLEGASAKARHYRLHAGKVSIFLKTKEFKYHAIEIRLPTRSSMPETIFPIIAKTLDSVWKKGVLYRTTGVILHNLSSVDVFQEDLFGESGREKKLRLIHQSIDDLEKKFGPGVIYLASTNEALKKKFKGATDIEDKDRNLLFT